jgi:hypothetical protein
VREVRMRPSICPSLSPQPKALASLYLVSRHRYAFNSHIREVKGNKQRNTKKGRDKSEELAAKAKG